jgi:N-acetylglucosamine-6-sulfatase
VRGGGSSKEAKVGSIRVAVALSLLVVAASVGAIVDRGTGPIRSASDRPSIVLILTDDQRWDTLWSMPNVHDLLVGHGVTFSNGFVVNSLCCPSRTSILTGQYSHTTRVYKNRPPYGGFQTFGNQDRSTVATWLHAAGYTTGLVGKYLNSYENTKYIPPGWDRWVAFSGPTDYYDYTLNIDGRFERHGSRPEDYSTRVLAAQAVDFIKDTSGPLFLYFAPDAPHAGAIPDPQDAASFPDLAPWRPPSFDEPDVSDKPAWVRALPRMDADQTARVDRLRTQTYQTLQAVDRAVGDIVAALQETGRLGSTMIVFTSDNGLTWGEHRWVDKVVPYEESIRVPLVVRFDQLAPIARTEDRLALNLDLAQTFAQLAGVGAPHAEGMSLVPLLANAATSWRQDFLVEHLDPKGKLRDPRDLVGVPTYCELRTIRYAYVQYGTGEEELYDLEADPYELSNIATLPEQASLILGLRARLADLCDPPPPGMRVLPSTPPG